MSFPLPLPLQLHAELVGTFPFLIAMIEVEEVSMRTLPQGRIDFVKDFWESLQCQPKHLVKKHWARLCTGALQLAVQTMSCLEAMVLSSDGAAEGSRAQEKAAVRAAGVLAHAHTLDANAGGRRAGF